ncbi:Uncharacterised protein [Dorea longicatena]|uniref:Uncharacterized protein n=1 Tax=Dorea longicatena TaxID=88431 RepID=A0A564TUU2_9FIRM|nr:Uncharacterised protein [Dorea longicatena]
MSSRGIFILAITWIVMSPFWFWAENIALEQNSFIFNSCGRRFSCDL